MGSHLEIAGIFSIAYFIGIYDWNEIPSLFNNILNGLDTIPNRLGREPAHSTYYLLFF